MGIVDYMLMALIIGGALYMLYRSFRKNKGPCSGCSSGTCDPRSNRK